jgi:hypothetical protein
VDYDILDEALGTLQDLWEKAALLHTPKLHSLLMYSPKQMRFNGGFGYLFKNDVEKMHQILEDLTLGYQECKVQITEQ